jgi:hypothetical protein
LAGILNSLLPLLGFYSSPVDTWSNIEEKTDDGIEENVSKCEAIPFFNKLTALKWG